MTFVARPACPREKTEIFSLLKAPLSLPPAPAAAVNPHKRSRGAGQWGAKEEPRALGPGGHSPRSGCCLSRGRLPNPGVVERAGTRAGIPPSGPLSSTHPRKRFPGRAEAEAGGGVHLGDRSHGHCILNCDYIKLKLGSATRVQGSGPSHRPVYGPCFPQSPHRRPEGRTGGTRRGGPCCRLSVLQMRGRARARRRGVGGECEQVSAP